MTATPTESPVEKVSPEELKVQFTERLTKLVNENNQLAAKIKENETTALKLQGALETLQYLEDAPPGGVETVDEVTTEE